MTVEKIVDEPVIVKFDPKELSSGVPTDEHVGDAVRAFQADGIVVLDGIVSHEHLDSLNERMCTETEDLIKRESTHFNWDKSIGNVSQYPPVVTDMMYKDVYANPIAGAVLAALLGPRPKLRYLHGNTALKGVGRQDVHSDLFFDSPNYPFAIAANIMLVDATIENGTTEVWLGTARDTGIQDRREPNVPMIKTELLEERRKVRPPVQPFVPKGSIVLRDLRTWHAGVANGTDTPRMMLALVHFASWYGNRLTLKFPESARSQVEEWNQAGPAELCVEYIPDAEYDHLGLTFNADFSPVGGHPDTPMLPTLK